jgi:GWxTD domain-containing protein
MRKHLQRLSFLLLLALCTSACRQTRPLTTLNLSSLYNPGEISHQAVQSLVYHSSDSFSNIYFRINRALLAQAMETLEAEEVHFRYALYPSFQATDWIDTGRISIVQAQIEGKQDPWYPFSISVPTLQGKTYILFLELIDSPLLHHICLVDREWHFSQQNVLLTNIAGDPLFDPVLSAGQECRLSVADGSLRKLRVHYYQRTFDVAWPPFAFNRPQAFDLDPDSVFYIPLESGVSEAIRFPEEGMYHLLAEEGSMQGKTLLRFHPSFPLVLEPGQMLAPLQYLTSAREYSEMQESDNPKVAVDRFWLTQTGNVARARVRIQEFYSRVEQANLFFTSYHEGWKTDRGLIYIIYGPPRRVFRTDEAEKWIYGEEGNPLSLRFTFMRVKNPFTLQDYSLTKSPTYKESWFNQVETWRR